MSRRHDISDGTGIIVEYLPLGRVFAYGNGAPSNGVQGFAPGCLYLDLYGTTGSWENVGTFLSSLWQPPGGGAIYTATGASTAITASSAETAFSTGSYVIPANMLQVGTVLRIYFQGIQTAEHSTDTLQVKLYIGGTGGTALITIAAAAGATNNIFAGEILLTVRTTGTGGTFVGSSSYIAVPAAAGTASRVDGIVASTAIDTTVTEQVVLTGKFSTTDAGNSVRLDVFDVFVL